ncbi:MAG: hypothetical protein ACI9U2_002622 [Bradymonadia bacterium]|jgi:hypothetical protein
MSRLFWVMIALLWAAPISAQAADPAQERAKNFFVQGSKDFAEGRFARALDAFEQANAIKPHPIMLKNIAKTYEAMKDLTRAVGWYEKYLATGPSDSTGVTATIARLKTLIAKWSRLTLVTTPGGATIWVGSRENRPRGKTPDTLVIQPGQRTLVIALPGYEVVERTLTLAPAQALTMPPIAMVKLRPRLVVTSEPMGAQVFVDGAATPAGRTPFTVPLTQGDHTLRFEAAGYRPTKQTVTLTDAHVQAPLRTAAKLQEGKAPGELVIELDRGEVFIDGRSVGKAPLQAPIELDEGMHPIEVRGGGEVYREMVSITSGETTTTTINIEGGGGSSISQGTVGWILIGTGSAVVLGGIVTSFLALGADGDLQDCRGDAACAFTERESVLADDVRSSALTTDILMGVGVAIAATGTVLYLLADDAPTRQPATQVPAISVTPLRGGGAAAVGRFEF